MQEDAYLLACQRYIELNPVRANMVEHPAEYPWSSYRAHAQGEPNPLLTPHALYEALGHDSECRQSSYRELFRHELESGLADQIRQATNGNYALGNERFAQQITQALGQRALRAKAGRPTKIADTKTLDLLKPTSIEK